MPPLIRSNASARHTRSLYRVVRQPPTWHPELTQAAQAQNLLGALAVGVPFAKLLICEDRETQTFTIDLRHMQAYPVREGLCRLGCKINFVAQDGRLTVANIVYNDETVSPGGQNMGHHGVYRLCSLVTHLTVWRHGMQYHVAGLAPVAVITHNLPPAHPIRRLLAVHIAETLLTNYYTHLTLRRSGFDVTGFSFPRDVIFRYYDDGAKAFDLTTLDVRLDIAQRGMRETLWYPYASQALRYYNLFASYVSAYVQHYYPDDRALQADVDACAWFDMLDRSFVNGIRSYVPSLTKDNLIKFCTLFIYSVTVEHEQNTLWDYAVFLPTTVRQDGIGQSVGEVQSVLNFQFVISSATNRLMHYFSALALDAAQPKSCGICKQSCELYKTRWTMSLITTGVSTHRTWRRASQRKGPETVKGEEHRGMTERPAAPEPNSAPHAEDQAAFSVHSPSAT